MNIETFKTKLSALIFKLLLFMFLISINNENAFSNVKYITLSGIVSESESGENIIGVPVALYKDTTNKNAARGAITNKFGFYSIPKLSEGEYYLMVSGIGYETFIQKIIISKDTILNIKLNIQAIMSEEVIVTAERLSEPINRISSVIVKPDFVMKMPSIGGEIDVFRTLQLLPGVKQGSELSSGLYIRGGSADQNLV